MIKIHAKLAAALRVSTVVILGADAAIIGFWPEMLAQEFASTGFTMSQAPAIAIILAIAILLYEIPRTMPIGAILITGFLGGAICAHFRLGEIGSPPQIICLLLGAFAWCGVASRYSIGMLPTRNSLSSADEATQGVKAT
ncbi:MAG: DoxX family protein [Sphingomonadales bacterium]|nr:MAG: DoxX family protein [Sphingomonadales bacterium]